MKQFAGRFCTLIVLSNASSRLHKVHLPLRWLWVLAVAGFVLFSTIAGLVFRYVRMTYEISDFNALQAENRDLRIRQKNLELSTKKLNIQIDQAEALSQEITSLVETNGLFKKSSQSGVGGSAVDRSTDDLLRSLSPQPDVESLKARVDELRNQMTNLHEEIGFRISQARVTPNIWPLEGAVLSPFGQRTDPFGEGAEFHEGIDIGGNFGAPVRATADGIVIFAERQSDYGNLIIIDHGDGITTRFGHLSRFQIKSGDSVKKGDIVGYVGMTGRTTGPHLHYEVRVNDRAVNPQNYLPR